MKNATTLSIAVLAAAIGFTLTPALHAQEAAGAAAPQTPGMSDHGHSCAVDAMVSKQRPQQVLAPHCR